VFRPTRLSLAVVAATAAVAGTALAVPAGADRAAPSTSTATSVASASTPGAARTRAIGEFAPSAQLTQVLRQPDGSRVEAVMTDVAVGSAFEKSGYSIGKDAQGWWRYASGRDAQGRMVLSGVRANLTPPAGLTQGAARQAPTKDDATASQRSQFQENLRIASNKAAAQVAAGGSRTFKFPVLMLATWWDTDKDQTSPQFQDGTSNPAVFKRLLDGFGGNPSGTLTEFYYESSFGQFLVQVDVFGPFVSQRSRQDRCYYGNIGQANDDGDLDLLDTNLGVGGGGALGMALEVVPQADPTVNFAPYDNDGNGSVDFTAIIHSGADMAVTGDPCNTWSHALQATLGEGTAAEELAGLPAGTLARAGIATNDGVSVDRVLTMPEFNSKSAALTIGVAVHEMGHAIGEPDYYNTTYNSAGDGEFDIMGGSGYFGHPSGSSPGIFNPASRVFQGWVKPTFVHDSLKNVTLKARNVIPYAGYDATKTDPNLLLVPVYEIAQGETDKSGHTWSANDIYGMAKDPKTGKYVVEGYYVELTARTVNAKPLHAGQKRGAIFDRSGHGSGLIVWHFDNYRRSNTYFGGNDAQNDGERYQMDVEEFDKNDNTQELQRNETRGGPEDYLLGAATGITSGTRQLPPGSTAVTGKPSDPIDISGGPSTPATSTTDTFVVPNNPANVSMKVSIASDGVGDCKLALTDPKGKTYGPQDSTGPAESEELAVDKPAAGTWTVTVSDFAACATWSGTVRFEGGGAFVTSGAADTWSNWSSAPTGWAFTNVGPAGAQGTDSTVEGGDAGQEKVTLDVLQLGGKVDVSPGFAGGALLPLGGRGPVSAGASNAMSVPVFSNGSKPAKGVVVTIREGSATGKVVARKTVDLAGYARTEVPFTWTPTAFGPTSLVATIDEGKNLAEASESNNAQSVQLDVTPAAPKVLVVDDDGAIGGEATIGGSLAALGVPYAIAEKHPTAALMKKYSVVVWQTGIERYFGQVDPNDRGAIASYLDGGGKVLLAGNRLFDALGSPPSRTNPSASDEAIAFLGHYFGARFSSGSYNVVQSKQFRATGTGVLAGYADFLQLAAGRGVVQVAGLSSAAAAPNGKTNLPYGTAKPAMTFPLASFPAVQPASETPNLGISVAGNAAHRSFRTLALGFSLSQGSHADQTAGLLQKAMTFFGVKTGAPLAPATPVIYHSAVRDSTAAESAAIAAVVLGAGNDPVVLHYRRHGQGGYYAVPLTKGSKPATYSGVIPSFAVTPDGVDYWLSVGSGGSEVSSPLAARSGSYAHAIGVHIPEASQALGLLPSDQAVAPGTTVTTPRAVAPGGLAATGGSPLLASLALLLLVGGAVAVRRRQV
jgi:M6 family metalloprotease-like protein